jgi:hypothetical protein
MDTRVLVGLLEVVALAAAPVVMVSILVRTPQIYERSVTLGRRVSLLHTPPTRPASLPIEKLAADLRRLRPACRSAHPDARSAKQQQIVATYDAVLIATARALDVDTTLAGMDEGMSREVERRRLEQALEAAGLRWELAQD